ncbi:MAG: HsdM family class I SAM-dependent methyltransferase [Jejuia sp.]
MNTTIEFENKTKSLIDDLKSVCANYGLGNDGNEFKIITQVFLYKFMNDKFVYELKQLDSKLESADDIETSIASMDSNEYELLVNVQLDENTAVIRPEYFISSLFQRQNEADFDQIFDNALLGIAKDNSDIFSVITEGGEKIVLFENISNYVTDNRDAFCKALVNKLVNFSFEKIFNEKFDFFSTIFEYLIKDYNTNSGGKYAEYFTPHAVSKIMARCLVRGDVQNISCYDPSAGSGTLLMNLAHQIGEDKCTIYSQDISQKSSNLLRLNLILNNLVHSIPNIVKGNTIMDPYHKENGQLRKFDYIVSNPPFKLDFSDYRDDLDSKENNERFFAGIPNIKKKKPEGMEIYFLFIQHIMYSLKSNGKAAIVVPTGFITAQSGIGKKIRQKLVEEKMLAGVITMPSNIFATTGTNVSVLFIDKGNKEDVILIDASNLGKKIKEGKNQKTVLTFQEEEHIIKTFTTKEVVEDFSIVVSYDELEAKNYSMSAGQYFEVKIEYLDISQDEFSEKMKGFESNLQLLFDESRNLETEIKSNINNIEFDNEST